MVLCFLTSNAFILFFHSQISNKRYIHSGALILDIWQCLEKFCLSQLAICSEAVLMGVSKYEEVLCPPLFLQMPCVRSCRPRGLSPAAIGSASLLHSVAHFHPNRPRDFVSLPQKPWKSLPLYPGNLTSGALLPELPLIPRVCVKYTDLMLPLCGAPCSGTRGCCCSVSQRTRAICFFFCYVFLG